MILVLRRSYPFKTWYTINIRYHISLLFSSTIFFVYPTMYMYSDSDFATILFCTSAPSYLRTCVYSTASFWCTNCTNSVHNTTAAQSVTTRSGDNINLVTRPSSDTVIVVTWSPGHINTELASPEQLASKCELRMWGCLLYMFETVSTSRAPGTAPDPRHYGDTRSLLVWIFCVEDLSRK